LKHGRVVAVAYQQGINSQGVLGFQAISVMKTVSPVRVVNVTNTAVARIDRSVQ